MLKASGKRPRVFLANLGTAADFTARATFAKSFFEAGGIEAIDSEGFSDPAALAAAFKASGAPLAFLCSSDKVYAQHAVDAAKALKAAGRDISIWQAAPATGSRTARSRRGRFHLRRRRCACRAAKGL